MIEKLAEVVREQGIISGAEYDDKSKKIELSLCLQVESPVTINADITNPISAEQEEVKMLAKKIKLYKVYAFKGSSVSVLVADIESHEARKTAWKQSPEIRQEAKKNKTGYYGLVSSAIYKGYIAPEIDRPQVLIASPA